MPQLTLQMIDTWAVPSADSSYAKSGDGVLARSREQRHADMVQAIHATQEFASRRIIMHEASESAAARTPDSSLDFVFIDADHSYEGVSTDLKAWAPKVRAGGVLCGHDYDNGTTWGVSRAVKEYADEASLRVLLGSDWTWFIHKAVA